ncbi:epithelial sodium channel subunit beta-like isoform X2 [Amphiura filiformis]|uniref:epithelial sodium channel subunit beta-like isoform X2 n=1 Tax=Amphiura filiformis TaxID=82378 RepID=UPI003B214713
MEDVNVELRYQDWDNTDFNEMDSRHTLIDTTTDIIGAMEYEERVETGHQLDDMLLSCTFQGYPCTPNNFTWFYNYLYGNCYTFNLGLDSEIHEVTTAGPLLGLTMSLYIQQDEYIADIQQGAGIRVEVHPQKSMSFPEDRGLNVAPGTEAFVSVRKKLIKRKVDPYTNCTEDGEKTIFMDHFPYVEYSKLMCEKDCYYNEVLRKCGCADVRYRYDNSTNACNSTNPENVKCLREMQMPPCPCTFACIEDIFTHVVSYSLWPNDKHKPTVQDGIKDISDNLKRNVENDTSFVEKNVVKLNVYYDELTYDYIYHTATYGEYDLLSDIGGNVGLWIGISVLTVVELFELLYDVIILCFVKAKSAGEKSTSEKKDTSDVELVDSSGKAYLESPVTGQKSQLPIYDIQNHPQHQQRFLPELQLRRDSQVHPIKPSRRSRRGSRRSRRSEASSQSGVPNPQSRYYSADDLYYQNHPDSFDATKVVYNPAYMDSSMY